jgi:hypothetical protein
MGTHFHVHYHCCKQRHHHHRLGKARHVRLALTHKIERNVYMLDATLSWKPAKTGTPTGYSVVWSYNGTALAPQKIPATAAADAAGYSLDFANANPTITVKAGDIIGASVQTLDDANGLMASPVSAPPVTEPTAPVPPGPAEEVTLVLS